MIVLPAVDLYEKKAVRLYKGDYGQMTVYSDNPVETAMQFESKGATHLHMVDLEGAKNGGTPNLSVVEQTALHTALKIEIGGGIRNMETVDRYLSVGVDKVILGTAAVENPDFLEEALKTYGTKIAVGADVRDGYIAVKGWREKTPLTLDEFLKKLVNSGVSNVICTDISKDGAMNGTNLEMYRELSVKYPLDITASGGVSTVNDIMALRKMNIYGVIIGKACYTGDIDISEATEAAK